MRLLGPIYEVIVDLPIIRRDSGLWWAGEEIERVIHLRKSHGVCCCEEYVGHTRALGFVVHLQHSLFANDVEHKVVNPIDKRSRLKWRAPEIQ